MILFTFWHKKWEKVGAFSKQVGLCFHFHLYGRERSSFIIFIHQLQNKISRPNGGSHREQERGPIVAPIIILEDQSFVGIPVRFMFCIYHHLHLSRLLSAGESLHKSTSLTPFNTTMPLCFSSASVSWYTPHQLSPIWACVCKSMPFLNVINRVSNFSG